MAPSGRIQIGNGISGSASAYVWIGLRLCQERPSSVPGTASVCVWNGLRLCLDRPLFMSGSASAYAHSLALACAWGWQNPIPVLFLLAPDKCPIFFVQFAIAILLH